MATKTFTQLTEVTTLAAGDELVMWNAAAGAARKVTAANFIANSPNGGLAEKGAANTFTEKQTITASLVQQRLTGTVTVKQEFYEENGGVDGKMWDFLVYGGALEARIVSDSLAAASDWLVVTRSGTTVSTVAFPNGNLLIGTTVDSGYRMNLDAGAMRMAEMTAPSAPGVNSGVMYLEDNGSGKTRMMVLFATGAAQQVAIQP